MIQNGYALEQRSGWVEAGRERVGKEMEGERCVGLETGRGRIAVRGFGDRRGQTINVCVSIYVCVLF